MESSFGLLSFLPCCRITLCSLYNIFITSFLMKTDQDQCPGRFKNLADMQTMCVRAVQRVSDRETVCCNRCSVKHETVVNNLVKPQRCKTKPCCTLTRVARRRISYTVRKANTNIKSKPIITRHEHHH